MSQNGTSRRGLLLASLVVTGAVLAPAQPRPDWRKVGTSAVELMLAAPATGPVDRIWFSADGSQLFARTANGKTFATADFETWTPADGALAPVRESAPAAARLPEPGAHLASSVSDSGKLYALGLQFFRSEDGGHSWINLTQNRSESVIGGKQHDLAISPVDSDQLVLANDYGVWRSMDGGLSWAGLNRFLPNLPVRRILSAPSGTAGTRVEAEGLGILELPPGGATWFPAGNAAADPERALRQQYSATVGAEITAAGASGLTAYAGSSDGRIWVSFDGGATFRLSRTETGAAVEKIFVDSAEPRVALAALGGSGPHVLRTTNSGSFWDNLTANLPDVPAHGITAERAAGAVYVATDRGVFWARTDLENASSPSIAWASLTDGLPAAPASDVRLNPTGVQLYIALDGYGVYATAAPHRLRSLRIVNAADFSARAAAPGSLLSIIGGRVASARGGNLDYPVLSASDGESQIQVPFEAAGSNVDLSLQTNSGPITLGLPMRAVSPAIFVGQDGAPMLVDADSGLWVDGRNPGRSNGRIQILATGLGKVRPEWPTNLPAPAENPPVVAAEVKAYLDGAPLQVTRATLAPLNIGWYLIEVQLPAILNLGTSELYITGGGQESNRVQIVTEP